VEEGLAELHESVRLAPRNADYRLDYADALLCSGNHSSAGEQALVVWERRADGPADRVARSARLLARVSRATGRPEDEARWLRELLRIAPDEQAAADRLSELSSVLDTKVIWRIYEHGVDLAQRRQQPLLLLFETASCMWCKFLHRNVFSNPDVVRLSREFVCVRVDAGRRLDLARRYGVNGFPTVVFLASSGGQVHRVSGYRPPAEFLAEMRRARGPAQPDSDHGRDIS
jgi:thiol:disulfide interchange protein